MSGGGTFVISISSPDRGAEEVGGGGREKRGGGRVGVGSKEVERGGEGRR